MRYCSKNFVSHQSSFLYLGSLGPKVQKVCNNVPSVRKEKPQNMNNCSGIVPEYLVLVLIAFTFSKPKEIEDRISKNHPITFSNFRPVRASSEANRFGGTTLCHSALSSRWNDLVSFCPQSPVERPCVILPSVSFGGTLVFLKQIPEQLPP